MDNFYTEEEKYWLTGGNTGTLPDRITPSKINVLKENEIFVFGSNIKGAHLGGAARAAYNKFGAEWGNGEGLQGKSYALPTMEGLDKHQESCRTLYTMCQRTSGTGFLCHTCRLWHRWLHIKGDCTFVQGCGATLECISSYQFLEKLDGIH